MCSEESLELLDIVKQDENVRQEAFRALKLYQEADYKTKSAIGEHLVIEKKLLESAIDSAVDTITRVSTERDYYKDIVGDTVNNDVVQGVLENKMARMDKKEKNRIALTEIKKTLNQNKAICKQGNTKVVEIASGASATASGASATAKNSHPSQSVKTS